MKSFSSEIRFEFQYIGFLGRIYWEIENKLSFITNMKQGKIVCAKRRINKNRLRTNNRQNTILKSTKSQLKRNQEKKERKNGKVKQKRNKEKSKEGTGK